MVGNNATSWIDILGLNKWQSQDISDFTSHYFSGDSEDFDLIDEGFQADLENVLSIEIALWKQEIANKAKEKANELAKDCKCDGSTPFVFGSFSHSDQKAGLANLMTKPIGPWGMEIPTNIGMGFVLRKAWISKSYTVSVSVNCCKCNYIYDEILDIAVRDSFRDPLSNQEAGQTIPNFLGTAPFSGGKPNAFQGSHAYNALQEFFGDEPIEIGDPYNIKADWSLDVSGSGTVDNCPCVKSVY